MGGVFFDVRYCVRRLMRQPGFAASAVLTLALGIGANAALFTVLNAVFLRPTPGVEAPEQLAAIYTSDYSGPAYGGSSYPDYESIAALTDVFSGVAAHAPRIAAVGDPAEPLRIGTEVVSPGYFDVLGLRVRGRGIMHDDAAAHARVAVVSESFWRTHLAESDDAAGESGIGRTILVNGRPVTVIGIAPPGFRGLQRGFAVDLWVAAHVGEELGLGVDVDQRGNRGLMIMARMRDGIGIDQSRARLRVLASQLHASYREAWTDLRGEGRRLTIESERKARVFPGMRGVVIGFAALLSAMVAVVLLICCANVAGLMLARVTSRTRDFAIRRSLGATQWHVRRVMLIECLLLAVAGGFTGLVLAIWTIRGLLGLIPDTAPVPIELAATPDWRVIAFTAVISTAAALLFGLAPSFRAGRADLTTMLKGDLQFWRSRRIGLRELLVGAQVAASVVLLVTALLFLRSLRAVSTVDPGYNTENLVLVDIEPRPGQEPSDNERVAAVSMVVERLRALPDISAVSWAERAPLGLNTGRRNSTVERYSPAPGEDMEFHYNPVGPDYFETIGLKLVRGRGFTAQDRMGAPGVIVVNESFARRFWQGEDPLGKRVSVTGRDGEYLTVIGVARDAKMVSLSDDALPYMYLPALQMMSDGGLHVRTTREPAAILSAVNAILPDAAPAWSARNARNMKTQIAAALLPQHIAGRAFTAFGLLALLLAMSGLYGIVAFTVAQRTRELGIRVALGASTRDVIRVTVTHGIYVVLCGVIAGLLLAFAGSRLITSLLPGTTSDSAGFVIAPALLIVTSVIAMYVPARRATSVDPMTTLRV